jgi:hypothetical protein
VSIEGRLKKLQSLRDKLQNLYELHKRTTSPAEADNAKDKIIRILGKYGKSWFDLQQAIDDLTKEIDDLKAKIDPGLLELIEDLIDRYIYIPDMERTATALWILHTHVFSQFNVTPRLVILAPTFGWGKTALLEIVQNLVPWPKPDRLITPSVASLYQLVDSGETALLIDEGDNLGWQNDNTLRAILNANRQGEVITRGGNTPKGGGSARPKKYRPFIPIAVAGRGGLPRGLITRSITINMKLKPKHVIKPTIDEEKQDFAEMVDATQMAIRHWASNIVLEYKLDTGFDNRLKDNWRPLIAIADSLSRGEMARRIAKALTDRDYEHDSIIILLMDIRTIFNRLGRDPMDRIGRDKLLKELHELDRWNEHGRKSELTKNELFSMLRSVGVTAAHPIYPLGGRDDRGKSERGYYRKDFEEAWKMCPDEDSNNNDIDDDNDDDDEPPQGGLLGGQKA